MLFSHPLGTRRIVGWSLLAGAFLLLLGSGIFLHRLMPSFGASTYAYADEARQPFTPPLYRRSGESPLLIDLTLIRTGLSPTRYTVFPDDCITEITVNDHRLPLNGSICMAEGGTPLHLASYLSAGENRLSFTIDDHGGWGGLSITPSLADPLVLSGIVLLLLGGLFGIAGLLTLLRTGTAGWLLGGLLACGFLVRFAGAPLEGYSYDVTINQQWAKSAVELGMSRSYEEQTDDAMLPNYPPLGMMLFTGVGHVYETVFSPGFDRFAPVFRVLIKLPAILADIVTALLLFFLLASAVSRRAGFIGAGVYALHPAVIYDSAVWGQVDSIFTLFIVASLLALTRQRWLLTGALAALAVLFKLQAIIVTPVLLLFFLKGWRPALRIIFGGLLATGIVLLPFALTGGLDSIWRVYLHSVGYYPQLSYGAYNLWQALFDEDAGRTNTEIFFWVLSYRQTGLLLFALALLPFPLLRLKALLSERNPLLPFLYAALSAYAFFLLNTEMHERYLFPLMPLGLPLLFLGRGPAISYVIASVLFLLNLLGQLSFVPADKALFTLLPDLKSFIGAVHTCVFVLMYAHVLRIAKTETRWTVWGWMRGKMTRREQGNG